MNRRYKRKRKDYKLKKIVLTHIENNIKNYTIVSVIFLIGIVIGVIFINNSSEYQSTEITSYISSFKEDLKNSSNINTLLLLKDSIKKNVLLAIFLWFMGSTVIGISIVYLTICFRGFCLGYTISSMILTFGIRQRSIIFIMCVTTANYCVYTMYNSSCSKWNEAT